MWGRDITDRFAPHQTGKLTYVGKQKVIASITYSDGSVIIREVERNEIIDGDDIVKIQVI